MNSIDRRNFVKMAACLPLAKSMVGVSETPEAAYADAPIGPHENRSPLDPRFALTLDRVLRGEGPRYDQEFLLADVRPTSERRFTEFSGDLSGRYIGAMATAARVYGIEAPGLDGLVAKTIALQKPEGYFGSPFHFEKLTDADMALLWGNGRLLVGLLEYHQWKPSPAVFESSKRIGDFLVRVSPIMLSKEIRDAFGAQHFAASYICWTQLTEGLAGLYSMTNDERYRALAEQIAVVTERRAGDHAHGYLSSLRGIMDLHAQTKDEKLLRQCEGAWEQITASRDLLITGGVPEGWSPNNHRTEGCGEADWVRLNLQLWHATENARYLAMAEKAIFNEFAFNQFASGDYGHHVYTETGLPAGGAVRAWWCCTLHGLRCFPDIYRNAFRPTELGVSYDLPVNGRIEAGDLSAVAMATLETDASVHIRILRSGPNPVAIDIRKPAWADGIECRFEGRSTQLSRSEAPAGYERVHAQWRSGDVLVVRYRMKLRSQSVADDRRSYWYGPWLLGASAAGNSAYFNELTPQNQLLDEGSPASPIDKRDPRFSIPAAAVRFRPAQAEFPDQPGTVILRPIAEQTGEPTTSWEVSFRSRGPR